MIFFKDNVKILRVAHNLSTSQMADILGLKNRTSIVHFESGFSTPLYDVLLRISNLFAVSIDWLVGRSPYYYQSEIIANLENELSEKAESKNIKVVRGENLGLIYFSYISNVLFNSSVYFKNVDKYTLAQRADVVYSLNFWLYASQKLYDDGYDAQIEPIQSVLSILETNRNTVELTITGIINYFLDSLKGSASSKRAGTAFAALCHETLDVLKETVNRPGGAEHYCIDIKKATEG